MKRGFKGSQSPKAEELFQGLDQEARDLLADGFGGNIGECWHEAWSTRVDKELKERSRGDLEKGLVMIRKEV